MQKHRLRRWLIIPAVLIGVALLALLIRNRAEPESVPLQEQARAVRIIQVPRVDVAPIFWGYGNVTPEQIWDGVAEVAGKIVTTHPRLKRGALIRAGETLLRIDPSDYQLAVEQAKTDIAAVEAQLAELAIQTQNDKASLQIEQEALALSDKELERKRKLLAKGTIPTSEFNQEERNVLTQRQSVQALRNTLNLYPAQRQRLQAELGRLQAQLTVAQLDLERTTMTMPFNGRIAEQNIEPNQYVREGDVLVVADSINKAEIEVQIPIGRLADLIRSDSVLDMADAEVDDLPQKLGLSARVWLRNENLTALWEGRVVRTNDTLDPLTRTVGLIIQVDQPYAGVQPGVRPPLVKGLFVNVELHGKLRPNTLVVPRSALHGLLVYLVNGDSRLVKREVTVAFRSDEYAAIRDGLEAGESLVVSDLVPAIEGMLLEPVNDPDTVERLLKVVGAASEDQKTLISYFVRHPTAANLLMLFLLVIGLTTLPTLQRETFPDFTPQEIEVRILYPGASPGEIEESICQRLEDAMDAISDVDEMRCEALEGVAVAVVRMAESGSLIRFLDDIKTEVEAIDEFPERAERPIIRQLARTDQVVSLAVTGPMSATHLKVYAEELKDRLQRLPSVSQITIVGFSQRQLQIRVASQALRQHGLSIEDLANVIDRQSVDLPIGDVETRERDFLIRFTDQRRTIQELEDLIVVGAEDSGGEVRLGEIAAISDAFEMQEEKVRFNGSRAALLQITKTKAEDTLEVVDAVQAFVEQERQMAPPGVAFALTQDAASIVRDRLQMLLKNGWQGLLLVFLVMWLFFRLRFAFWVAMGLPVSFLGGLFVMALLGYSINMLSMVALLIGLGLLMDDAIVIAENIATHLSRGKSALQAAIDGTRQVLPGVLSSFLTTIAVFVPLGFLSGDIGKVLSVVPVVLITVLAVSLVEAFLILPHHLGHSLRDQAHQHPNLFRRRFDATIEWLRRQALGKAIDGVIHWRYLFLGVVVALFLGSVGMLAGGHLIFQAFPDIEGDVIEARVLLPQGTPLWRTEAVVAQLTAALATVDREFSPQQPGEQRLVQDTSMRFNHNLDANEAGAHVATVSADLLTAEQRVGAIDAMLQRWREETGTIADALSINFKEPQLGPAGRAIEIRLSSSDLDALKTASLELQDWLNQYQGVLDLSDDLRPGKPEFRLRLREGSFALGLDAATIANQLRAGFFGATADEIQVGSEDYEIDVGLSASDQDSLADLQDFRIVTADGDQVPLSAVTVLEEKRGYARIHRIDGRRTVTITGDVDTQVANAQQIINDTRTRFLPKLAQHHPTVTVDLEGQAAESSETGASMARGFSIGLVGIFILLSFQFRSYIEPLAVMSAIPLALIGVIWGHQLMGLALSMPSMMGAASLAGIVVNDSILLVEFLKLRAQEGHPIPEAAKLASRERFRAVLLTSLTTIAGLTPLLTEKSLQAQVLIPLATSIVFGLLVATLLVLLVVPALFSVFSDLGWLSVNKGSTTLGSPPNHHGSPSIAPE